MCKPSGSNKKTAEVASSSAADNGTIATVEELSGKDQWLLTFDYDGFNDEIRNLGKKLENGQGQEDVDHLNKMILWSNSFAAVGLVSMGFCVNPISIFCLSVFVFTRWTMVAHHTCHGGYENCHPERKGRWSRFTFALGGGWRRFNDWFDWMMPEAWNIEHNNRHHYNLSEIHDPDLVEQNTVTIRELDIPVPLKYIAVVFLMGTWKWYYYAPNTYKELKLAQWRREGKKIPAGVQPELPISIKDALLGQNVFYSVFELIGIVMGPYFLIHFFLTPLPFYLLGNFLEGYTGSTMYWNAVTNLFLAELLTNAHGFLCIVTNHAGDDMYRFDRPCRPYSGSFHLRQVLASVDYNYGSDLVDFMHGYLNYQIEHHLWPNLSMRSYQKAAPLVKAICKKYGVPYVQQNCFWRLKKTVDIITGATSMRQFPDAFEVSFLQVDAEYETSKSK